MWPSTPAERRHLAWRCRTCCLRRFRASRPPQNSSFRGSIPHPIRSLCTLRIRRRRRLRNTRFPAARYHLTGAGLSPAGTRQLRLTHRNRKFESISLQRRAACEPDLGRALRDLTWKSGLTGNSGRLSSPAVIRAAMVAYVDDFKLIMLIALASIPLLLLLREVRRRPPPTAAISTAAADD